MPTPSLPSSSRLAHRLTLELRPDAREGFDVDSTCTCGWVWIGWELEAEAATHYGTARWVQHLATVTR